VANFRSQKRIPTFSASDPNTNLPGPCWEFYFSPNWSATNGVGYLTWSLDSGTLPGGLALGSFGVEVLTGTTTNSGLFNFTLRVTDSTGQTTTQAYSINVLVWLQSVDDLPA